MRSTFSGIKRYEKDLIDTHVQADNQLIIAVHDMKNQKNETIKERSQRNLKLSHMKKKELHLKQTNSNLTQKLSENIAKSEENFENKLDSEVKIASALSEFLDLKEMSQNYKNQLRFYKEEFIKIRK